MGFLSCTRSGHLLEVSHGHGVVLYCLHIARNTEIPPFSHSLATSGQQPHQDLNVCTLV